MTQPASAPGLTYQRSTLIRFLMQVLWPAFVATIVTTGVVFSAIDPEQIPIFGREHGLGREAAYTLGFVAIWVQYILACALTWWITSSDAQRVAKRSSVTPDKSQQGETA